MKPSHSNDVTSGVHPRKSKRCYPIEYKSWLYWEVGIPIACPFIIFFSLCWMLIEKHAEHGAVRALISISGSGDLLIFAALLLISTGAKFRILEVPRRSRGIFTSGDIDSETPFFLAIVILFLYGVARIALETNDFPDDLTIRFAYGVCSMVVLLGVFLWIDSMIRTMHTKRLIQRLNSGLIENQYNSE